MRKWLRTRSAEHEHEKTRRLDPTAGEAAYEDSKSGIGRCLAYCTFGVRSTSGEERGARPGTGHDMENHKYGVVSAVGSAGCICCEWEGEMVSR